jgi:hypothetical protein
LAADSTDARPDGQALPKVGATYSQIHLARPGADQSQLDLVPVAVDQRAVQMAIPIARHHAIGLHYQRLGLRHWGILGRRFLCGLHMSHGGPLFAFEVATGSAALANWPNQVASSAHRTASTRSLFACVEVSHRLIVCPRAKALTSSVADASICSRRGPDTRPPFPCTPAHPRYLTSGHDGISLPEAGGERAWC